MFRRFLSPAGATIEVDSGAGLADLSLDPTIGQAVTFKHWSFEFLVGRPELANAVASKTTGVSLENVYSTPGGAVRTGAYQWIDEQSNAFAVRMGVLSLGGWALLCHLYGPSTDDDVLELYEAAAPIAHEGGVAIKLDGPVTALESAYLA